MKTIVTLALFCAFGLCKAQTTMEEYTYITKGYHTVIDDALDVKKGYEVDKPVAVPMASGAKATIAFLRKADTHKAVAVIVYYHYTSEDAVDHYFCIPVTGSSNEVTVAALADWQGLFEGPNIIREERQDGIALLYLFATSAITAENCSHK